MRITEIKRRMWSLLVKSEFYYKAVPGNICWENQTKLLKAKIHCTCLKA